MDTTIETLMRQYAETTKYIKVYTQSTENLIRDIDVLTRKIRPKKWLHTVNIDDEMFILYTKKLELIEEYDIQCDRLEKLRLTEGLQLALIKDRQFRM